MPKFNKIDTPIYNSNYIPAPLPKDEESSDEEPPKPSPAFQEIIKTVLNAKKKPTEQPAITTFLAPVLTKANIPVLGHMTDEEFNNIMLTLHWIDRSDAGNAINNMMATANNIFKKHGERLKLKFNEKLQQLQNNTAITSLLPPQKARAILAHVIARGEIFTNAVISDPEFITYLFDDHVDITKFLD